MRYFRAENAVYEHVRTVLDSAWGHPDGKTVTCFMPASNAIKDSQNKCLLAVSDEFCGYSVAVEMLPQLLAIGAVEEVSSTEYWDAVGVDELQA